MQQSPKNKIFDMSQETNSDKKKTKFSRRKFLRRGGIVLGATLVGVYFGRNVIRRQVAQFAGDFDIPLGISNLQPDFWFEVQTDNTVVLKLAKMEMGQGIFTGAAMIAAEELGVNMDQIKVHHASTANGPMDMLGTGGSSSTAAMYTPLREVAATMRAILVLAAAKSWQLNPDQVTVENGILKANGKEISYADLTKQTTEWEVPDTPTLKPESAFQYVGTERKRVDLAPKVMGDAIYGIDQEVPNMLYATILRSPYIDATLKSADTSAAEQYEGVVKVVSEKNWIGVIAKNRFASVMACRQIKADWDVKKMWQQSDIILAVMPENGVSFIKLQKDGNVEALSQADDNVLSATYNTPIGVHAQIEPNGVIAQFEGDKLHIITGTQWAFDVRNKVAAAMGMDKDNVVIQTTFLGGGFGGRYFLNTAVEAAKLAKSVGQPVHLLRTREEEFQNRYYRPPTHHNLSAKVEDGKITAINHDYGSTDQAVKANVGGLVLKMLGADFLSSGHGTRILYNIENRHSKIVNCELPFMSGIWRGVGQFPNTFAIEAFIDELARKADIDPIQFRLDHLTDLGDPLIVRSRAVLEALRDRSGWTEQKAPDVGRGVAICEDRKSFAAAMIEVKKVDGKPRVTRVIQVVDPGKVINPDGVRMQVEGATMMGISATLYEATYIKDGKFAVSNYHQYPMATLSDTPEIEVHFIEGADKPYGVGEPPIGPVAPAIVNAWFDLTGERKRALPLLA
jgi:isoquinoline 1-oxidoreductase beta subunit